MSASDPVAILLEELRVDDASERIGAIRRLKLIAKSIGPATTRESLLPRLSEEVKEQDELLRTLAEELEDFVDCVGGTEHAKSLLPTLSALCETEETYVRDQAMKSTIAVIGSLPNEDVGEAVALFLKLAESDWFPPRISACGLVAALVARPGTERVVEAHEKLVTDDTPMVRRAAARTLGPVSKVLPVDVVASKGVALLNRLVHDDQESVRIIAVEQVPDMAEALSGSPGMEKIILATIECAGDRSWRVRQAIAAGMIRLGRAIGSDAFTGRLLDPCMLLLEDVEGEVKATMAKHLSGVDELIDADALKSSVVPVLVRRLNDALSVRANVVESAMEMVPRSTSALVPFIKQALGDEEGEVRLRVLGRLEEMAEGPGGDDASRTILPMVLEMSEDRLWRVREAVVRSLPALCRGMGTPYFSKHIMQLYMNAHSDEVNAVREAAAEVVRKLAESFGVAWAREALAPEISRMLAEGHTYMQRMQAVGAAKALCQSGDAGAVASVADVLITAGKDPVANVRVSACKALGVGLLHAEADVADKIRSALQATVDSDTDKDAKHAAKVSLAAE